MTQNNKLKRKRKSLVGWVRKGWIQDFYYKNDHNIIAGVPRDMQIPRVFNSKDSLTDKQVRITIEEV